MTILINQNFALCILLAFPWNNKGAMTTTKLLPTSDNIKVLFHTILTSIFFFFQSIFNLLNFQREFWIHHFRVMNHCLYSHEQRDRQYNRSNGQGGGRLVKIGASIHRWLMLNFEVEYIWNSRISQNRHNNWAIFALKGPDWQILQ